MTHPPAQIPEQPLASVPWHPADKRCSACSYYCFPRQPVLPLASEAHAHLRTCSIEPLTRRSTSVI
eukprot:scaffold392_cov350-Prasinococcus_capsulatus_cf.AAC.8